MEVLKFFLQILIILYFLDEKAKNIELQEYNKPTPNQENKDLFPTENGCNANLDDKKE